VALVNIFRPSTEPELIAVVAMLEAHEIPCFVHNAGFGGLYPGPQIDLYNSRVVMIPEEKRSLALQLISEFQGPSTTVNTSHSSSSKLRAFVEICLFGWFIPGGRHPKPRE
jgi:Putative prokaryotic signal transducing protein